MFMLVLQGLINSGAVIWTVLVMGAMTAVVMATGAIDELLNWAIYKLKDKNENILISIMFILMVYLGGFGGSDALIAVVPIGVVFCKKLKLDYVSATRAAMLHDLFLYDWHEKHRDDEFTGLHAFAHPKVALRNANKIFLLNDKEKDIILKHMWPVTIIFPKYREAYIVTFMDKYSACLETYWYIQSKLKRKTFYRYAYIFLTVLLLRVV